jgi:hypothetical protein
MSDPSLEIQAAMVAALKAAGALPAVVGARVYDAVPTSPAPTFPYVTLGDCQVLPDKAGCIDGAEVSLQIDVWSRATGYGEAKAIGKAILAKLDDQPLTVTGHDVVVFEHASTNYLRDPDGLTRHVAITFRSLTTPV